MSQPDVVRQPEAQSQSQQHVPEGAIADRPPPEAFTAAGIPDRDPASGISATQPDWSRETCRRFWDPSRQLLKTIRQYQAWQRRGWLGKLICKYLVLQHRFWSVVTATDIPLNCVIGGGLKMPHPTGIVISPEATIGPNCLILQQVTLTRFVHIGGHVDIGAGARLLRPLIVGNHAKIGANAVVLHDVPPGATAVGVPAKILVKSPEQVEAENDRS